MQSCKFNTNTIVYNKNISSIYHKAIIIQSMTAIAKNNKQNCRIYMTENISRHPKHS